MTSGIVFIALSALAVGGCSGEAGESAAAKVAAATVAPEDRLYDRQTFTIEYALTGAQTGTRVEHVRDWGQRRAETMDASMTMLGQTQKTRHRQVMEGATLWTVDPATGTVTVMDNPVYKTLKADMKGQSGVEYGRRLMREMGGEATGETAVIAGQTCEYFTLMGGRSCITDWGATLHVLTEAAGLRIEQKATAVRIGDGGPDGSFAVDKTKAQRIEFPSEIGGMTAEEIKGAGESLEGLMNQMDQIRPPAE